MTHNTDKPRYHILLVEDNEHDLIAVQNALDTEVAHFELDHYWQAEDVLEQFSTPHSSQNSYQMCGFDLIMSDHHLPGLSGLEFCQILLDNNVDVPLVLLTGAGAETLAVQALKMGVSDYLVKDLNQGYLDLLPVVLPDVVQRFKERQALRLAQAQLRDYAAELQMRNEELHAFAQMVAHDLKTPINTLLNAAEMLCDHRTLAENHQDDGTQTRENLLEIIERSGYKAANIVDDLLVLATTRQNEIVQVPLNMQDIVQNALDNLSNLVQKYQATISLPRRWPVAMGNSSWVEQVWVNYLSNGIKYGGDPPHLELGAFEQEDGMISFWIRDNGPGILTEDTQKLFMPFTQLVSSRSSPPYAGASHIGGHGLGLSIVKRIIEKLGGKVGVQNHTNAKEGSTFYFTLPSGLRT